MLAFFAPVAAFFVRNPLALKAAKMIGVGLALFLVGVTIYWNGRFTERRIQAEAMAVAQARQDLRAAKADAAADKAVTTATGDVARQTGDLKHADDALPDTRPSAVRRASACEWMRLQGADPATVSRCLAGQTGAGTRPDH